MRDFFVVHCRGILRKQVATVPLRVFLSIHQWAHLRLVEAKEFRAGNGRLGGGWKVLARLAPRLDHRVDALLDLHFGMHASGALEISAGASSGLWMHR